jgi:hypothetical protein
MKIKVEQRKKGNMPPFFRNTAQGQPTSKESRMTEAMETRPSQQSIQCWICGRNHLCRDFPQRGDKARTVHNVQQVTTVEDMGRNMPRIYAALENKKVEF